MNTHTLSTPQDLSPGQVALVRVDPYTGVPVSESGDWLKAGEEQYLAFENETEARAYAEARLRENPLLEWSLYDAAGNQLDVLHDGEALVAAARSKKK